jgi:hypothetical protein
MKSLINLLWLPIFLCPIHVCADSLDQLHEKVYKNMSSNNISDKGSNDVEFFISHPSLESFNKLEESARMGSASAQYTLGLEYLKEKSLWVKYNSSAALFWFKKAEVGGEVWAKMQIGFMYLTGLGVPQDYKKALKILEDASKDGSPRAKYYLARMYLSAQGVDLDAQKGLNYLIDAANLGDSDAIGDLGLLYENGSIVQRSLVNAYGLYNLSLAIRYSKINPSYQRREKIIKILSKDDILRGQELTTKLSTLSRFRELVDQNDLK